VSTEVSTPAGRVLARPAAGPLRRLVAGLAGRLVAATPLTWLVLFFAVPLGYVVVFSFAYATFGRVTLGFTLENYQEALSGFYVTIFARTVRFAVQGTVLVMLIAMPVAYFAARKAGRFKTFLLLLLMVPFWTSFLIRVLAWKTLLEVGGPVEDVLNGLHLHSGQLGWIDSPTAVFIGVVYAYLPMAVIPLFVAFERIPAPMLEASKDLGASRWRTLWHVTLPQARPGIGAAVLLVMIPMSGELVVPALLGGDRGVLYGSLIQGQFIQSANQALGSAMAMVLLVVVALAIAVSSGVGRLLARREARA